MLIFIGPQTLFIAEEGEKNPSPIRVTGFGDFRLLGGSLLWAVLRK
jgi:hypothetical protein